MNPLVSVVLLCSLSLNAQDNVFETPQTRKNAIKLNPFSLFFKTINLSYERVITSSSTLGISAHSMSNFQLLEEHVTLKSQGIDYTNTTSFSGYGCIPEYRYYLDQTVFNGVYIGGYGLYRYTYTSNNSNTLLYTNTYKTHQWSVGPLIGYQVLALKQRIALDATIGFGYSHSTIEKNNNDNTNLLNLVAPSPLTVRLAVRVGFSW